MTRGASAEVVAAELGVSVATAKRRIRELRGVVAEARTTTRRAPTTKRAPAVKTPPVDTPTPSVRDLARASLPSSDAEIPESTPIEQINEWLAMAKEEVRVARTADDLPTIEKMTRLATTLLALQQKYTRPPPPDPNEHPDFIAGAARVRKRWHELLDKSVGVSPAHAMAGLITMGMAIRANYWR